MTAVTDINLTIADGAPASNGEQQPRALPLHSAPSQPDLTILKRQRVKSVQDISGQEDSASQLESDQPDAPAEEQPEADVLQRVASPFCSATFTEPLLKAMPMEPMSVYFERLIGAVGSGSWRSVHSMELDGLYVHKRPIRVASGTSPLAVCGSVLHHVVVYVKQGPLLHSLDYGPASGADVTANILEDAPSKRILTTTTSTTSTNTTMSPSGADTAESGSAAGDAATGGAAPAAEISEEEQDLPYLFLGVPSRGVDDPFVNQVITFAESRRYHTLHNNCIHFADVLVRVMTAGAVRSAPLLYDITCGSVPPVDNPMLLMMQLLLQITWFMVADGSRHTAAFLAHLREQQPRQGQKEQPALVSEAATALSQPTEGAAGAPAVAEGPGGERRAAEGISGTVETRKTATGAAAATVGSTEDPAASRDLAVTEGPCTTGGQGAARAVAASAFGMPLLGGSVSGASTADGVEGREASGGRALEHEEGRRHEQAAAAQQAEVVA